MVLLNSIRHRKSLQQTTCVRVDRATVITDKVDYENRVKEMLEDEKTYEKLNKDPTPRFKKKLVSILSRLKSEDKVSDQTPISDNGSGSTYVLYTQDT